MKPLNMTVYLVIISLSMLVFSAQVKATLQPEKTALYKTYHINKAAIKRLYTALHQSPEDYLWINQQKLKKAACDALFFIVHADQQGFNPDHYHYDSLRHYIDSVSNQHDAHLFDQLLSDGLIKLIHDISVGRLQADKADPKWYIPQPSFDAVHFLQQAITTHTLKTSLDSIIPALQQYRQMQATLARYQLYVDCGGWSSIPQTPILKAGDFHPYIPLIRKRLSIEDKTLLPATSIASQHYDAALLAAVKRFQKRYSLKADGIIGPATLRAMNVPAQQRLQQIKISMERLRWLPANLGKRYILVNLASYHLTAVENNKIKLTMRVIVGRHKNQTPSFSSKIYRIVYNPYWHVPGKLARRELLPRQQANPDYFNDHHIRIFTRQHGKAVEVDGRKINWQAMNRHHFPYTLRQDPGKHNALGQIKFLLPNRWSIYLHDTPQKQLFSQYKRNFSHGCIRLEHPLALANFSLSGHLQQQTKLAPIVSDDHRYSTRLNQPVPVYAVYITVWHYKNEVVFSPDSYQRDQKIAKSL